MLQHTHKLKSNGRPVHIIQSGETGEYKQVLIPYDASELAKAKNSARGHIQRVHHTKIEEIKTH